MKQALRTVTPARGATGTPRWNAIGWGIFVGLVVMLPLLPILVVIWLLTKLLDRAARRATE